MVFVAFFAFLFVIVSASSPVAFLVQNELNTNIKNCHYASIAQPLNAGYFADLAQIVLNQNLDPAESAAIMDMAKQKIDERLNYELILLQNARQLLETQYNQSRSVINYKSMITQQAAYQNNVMMSQPITVIPTTPAFNSVFQPQITPGFNMTAPFQQSVSMTAPAQQSNEEIQGRHVSFAEPLVEESVAIPKNKKSKVSKDSNDEILLKGNRKIENALANTLAELNTSIPQRDDDSESLKSTSDDESVVTFEPKVENKRRRKNDIMVTSVSMKDAEPVKSRKARHGRPPGSKSKAKPSSSSRSKAGSSKSPIVSSEDMEEEQEEGKKTSDNKKYLQHNLVKQSLQKN